MTREEIDRELAALLSLAKAPPNPIGDSYLVVALARVVADQERRLRVLEPCPKSHGAGGPHVWAWPEGVVCTGCGITKEPPR